ncbi:MAG TPA: MarR family transcriptional regulator [Thermoanaerobaculia bacterium]|nr:MarR family transcriptional regulator [Thermoanaerobaculia bacterium]
MSKPSPLRIVTEDPALARDAETLYDAISELVRVYQSLDRDRICCHDISVSQCYALEALARRGGLTLNELAAHLYLDKSTASRVVDALERKGYVERSPHPRDGRALLLVATKTGQGLYGQIRQSLVADERALLAGFDPEVRQAMAQLLTKLGKAVATRLESGGSCCKVD